MAFSQAHLLALEAGASTGMWRIAETLPKTGDHNHSSSSIIKYQVSLSLVVVTYHSLSYLVYLLVIGSSCSLSSSILNAEDPGPGEVVSHPITKALCDNGLDGVWTGCLSASDSKAADCCLWLLKISSFEK